MKNDFIVPEWQSFKQEIDKIYRNCRNNTNGDVSGFLTISYVPSPISNALFRFEFCFLLLVIFHFPFQDSSQSEKSEKSIKLVCYVFS